jgi:hypothetical protein
MAEGYSRSPKLLKGALVQFSAPLLIPIPNIIIFQYNPESLSRSLSPYDPKTVAAASRPTEAGAGAGAEQAAPPVPDDAQPFDPTETFTLNLLLDATDALEEPKKHPIAFLSGVADRLAALEMLMYPGKGEETDLLGSAAASVSVGAGGISVGGSASATAAPKPRRRVPTLLFVWGPGRIVPVRLTSFAVEELQHNQLLYPHRAKVALGMRVVTSDAIRAIEPQKLEHDIAAFAYDFTFTQKQVLALANTANSLESLGLLPF